MTINLTVPDSQDHLKPRITVIGVGGAGGNAVNNMISSQLEGVEFVVANTDAQALAQTMAERSIQLGPGITNGLGAGSRPDIGRAAAEEAMDDLMEALSPAHMAFITAGMGGGTGTGAAPVIAQLAREHGILTVGVVTKPFQFEGINRMRIAEAGIEEMQQYVDTLIIIPNQNLFRIANEKTTFAEAFTMADEVLHSGVRGVTDLMVVPGLINLDFADIRAVMSEMGKAMMGTGEGDGEDRARLAAEAAISNPLLDDVSMKGARGVLINITGGQDMTLFEVDEAANRIGEEVDPDANIIFGSTMDSSIEGKMRVSVVATGIDAQAEAQPRPVLKVYSQAQRLVRAEETKMPSEDSESVLTNAEKRPETYAETMISEPTSKLADDTVTSESKTEPVLRKDPEPFAATVSTPPSDMTAEQSVPVDNPKAAATAHTEPRLVAENDAFMPPPPVDPAAQAGPLPESDPFKEADLLNGRQKDESGRRSGSLFQRITGSGRERESGQETAVESGPESIKTAPISEGTEKTGLHQTRLAGLDTEDRLQKSPSADDLLEIPAFLRRQAN
ncbi:MAG: Cell division protein FtsZ [Alphaproteobacteria bacterium MarineAlpha11_Bin1]|nr:MAG: Cell division protein FtsZ [Alphaproteobacteria bacterium MarineAlpha11_Bin1]|tara:strand:+ start:8596 stop:10278 length:1683 start_codon:yes stop_codon:yes gene_type:complete